MKSHRYIFKFILSLSILALFACSAGPADKPQADSFSSPAKLLDNGIHHYNNNNYPKAINDFEKALLQYRSIDNQQGIANSCLNLAKTYMAINNNQTAAEYLLIASRIIKQTPLNELNEHLHLLNSSLAINKTLYDSALQELQPVLNSKNTATQLAALKNRSRIAFIKNDSDKQQWLEEYKTLQQKHPENTSSHLARILRFEAELSDNEKDKIELLTQSLAISRSLADRTAIAANLRQWANVDIKAKRYLDAEDKYSRALFIRHQLGDVKNSLIILQQLQVVYAATNNNKQIRVESWINKLSNDDLSNWQHLFSDFENYPAAP